MATSFEDDCTQRSEEVVVPLPCRALDLLGIADGELAGYGLQALNRRLAVIGLAL
jgi:hypothetical protein